MPKKTDERTMEQATRDLGVHYTAWKVNESFKNEDKERFWKLAVQVCASRIPQEILVDIDDDRLTMGQATARAEKYNPRYEVTVIRQSATGYEAIMVERPEFMPFTYVNTTDEMVYSRQIVEGGQLLDDDRLEREDPDLFATVTIELPWGVTMVRPFETLATETLGAISKYIYRDKPTVKLPPPRAAKEEELAEVTDVP